MARQPTTVTMACDHCGELFKGNPRSQPLGHENYCSLQCEEGPGRVPISDPSSPDYHLHLKGEPGALVGRAIIASGLKRVDYSADWCRGPDDWSHGTVIDHSEPDLTYIRKDSVYLGRVVDYGADGYTIEREDMETGEVTTRVVHDFLMVSQLKNDRWWAE